MVKIIVLLLILLVDESLNQNQDITITSCTNDVSINFKFMNDKRMYTLDLCLSNSVCIQSTKFMIMCDNATCTMFHPLLKSLECNYSSEVSQTKGECSPTISMTDKSVTISSTTAYNRTATNLSIIQIILVALLVLFAVLLVIVSTGWVYTCRAMQKRRQKMNINTTNIR